MRSRRNHFICLGTVLAAALLVSTAAIAGPYTQIQILMPGETEAPGTASGKTGIPLAQTVGEPFNVRVRAVDDQWNLDTSITHVVQFASSDASATLPPNTSYSGGEMTVVVTFNAAGSFTVSAADLTDPTIPDGTSAAAQALLLHGFVFKDITQKHTYAGQPFGTSVTAVDPGGAVVTGFNGPVNLQQLTSYGVGRIEPASVTLTNGTWAGNVTVYRADETSINRGNVNMYAFLASDPAKNGTSNPFVTHPDNFSRVQLVVPGQDPLPGSVSGVTGSPATQSAAQAFSVDIFATDAYWNPLPSADNVRITSSDAGASTPVNATLSNGYASASLSLGTVGDQTLTVEDMSNGSIQGMTTAAITVIPAGAHHFEIDPIAGPLTAGVPVAVSIRATDAGGNTNPDFDGNAILAANTGAGSITPESITFVSGVWSGQITFRGAGNAVQFTCSDYATPPHFGTSDAFVVVPGPYTEMQVLLPGQSPQGGTADGFVGAPDPQAAGSAFQIRVRAVDQYFNRVPGINNLVELTSTDENLAWPVDPVLVNGEALLDVTLYRAGMQTISAADLDSTSIAMGTSSEVEVTAGTYTDLLILAPGEELSPGAEDGRSGTATDQSINYSFTVTVYATDAWFNPVAGVTDVIHISSGDPMAQLPADAPMVDGRADFSVRLAAGGFQQITASNVTQPAMTPSTTEVKMISSGFHLEAAVSPNVVQAGSTFKLTVRVTNDAGSTIEEYNSAVTVEVRNASTQDPGRGLLATTTFQVTQGLEEVDETYTFAEPIILIVTDDQGSLAQAITEPVNVLPGPPAELLLSSDPTWLKGNKTSVVTARIEDQFGNGVPEQTVEFSLVSGAGTLTAVDDTTSAMGDALAEYHSPREPGIDTIRVVYGTMVTDLDIETALVDPNAAGGTITNYPNPFHPDEGPTTIAYVLADNASVHLRIYTLSGGLVLDTQFAAGSQGGMAGLNEVTWDGLNGNGDEVASGGYVVYVEAEGNGSTMHVMRRKVGVIW